MEAITSFVDAFCDHYNSLGYAEEEDQFLPSKDTLVEVCEVLLNTSCLREEGRYSLFRVCFISPDSELLATYLYSHTVLFEQPVLFSPLELHKLVPALNAEMSYLLLDVTHKPFHAIGIVASYTTWERVITKEISTGNRMPRIPNILVNKPGELIFCFGETLLAAYLAGNNVFFRTDAFTSTFVAEELQKDSSVQEEERQRFLCRTLWNVLKYGHGGHLFIVPSAEACAGHINIKYKVSSRFAFQNESSPTVSWKRNEKDVISYADMISKFTMVDGAVVLTKEFDLLGFGAETLIDEMGSGKPDMCFIGGNGKEDKSKHYDDNGMRHRSCYQFCDKVEGTVAVIFSHDDVVKACTKRDGRVVVYDYVALPPL